MSSLCLFDYAYGFKSTEKDLNNEVRFIVSKAGGSEEDFQILLRQLESLRRVAAEHNIWMEPVYRYKFDNRLMTVMETKEYLHIGRTAVYQLCKQSDFPVVKIGDKLMVDRYKLDEYLDNHKEIKL